MVSVIAALAVVLFGIAPAHAEQRGKVYLLVNPEAPRTEWQRRPLPGAFVALNWTVTLPAPGHAVTSCRYSELARTDAEGAYVMEGPNPLTAGAAHVSYFVYSAGLEPISFPYGGSLITPEDITVAFTKLDPAARLSHISLFTRPGCEEGKLNDPKALLVPYLRAVLQEAQALKVDSDRGRQDVAHIEAVIRTAIGEDRPQPLRAVRLPSPGAIGSNQIPPR